MDNVNELIVKLCLAFDVLQQDHQKDQQNEVSRQIDGLLSQIDGLATNFNEILKNYNLEKYDEEKFNALNAKLEQIIKKKQIEKVRLAERAKNALGNVAEKVTQGFTQGCCRTDHKLP